MIHPNLAAQIGREKCFRASFQHGLKLTLRVVGFARLTNAHGVCSRLEIVVLLGNPATHGVAPFETFHPLLRPQNFDMTRIRFVLATARTTRAHRMSVRASWTQPVPQPRSGAYFNRRTLPQFSLDFSTPFLATYNVGVAFMDQHAGSSAAKRHTCVQTTSKTVFDGEDNYQTVCDQRSCSSKRVCTNLSSTNVFRDGSPWHIWVFSVSSVDSDRSSSNGLRSCALETLSSRNLFENTDLLAETRYGSKSPVVSFHHRSVGNCVPSGTASSFSYHSVPCRRHQFASSASHAREPSSFSLDRITAIPASCCSTAIDGLEAELELGSLD